MWMSYSVLQILPSCTSLSLPEQNTGVVRIPALVIFSLFIIAEVLRGYKGVCAGFKHIPDYTTWMWFYTCYNGIMAGDLLVCGNLGNIGMLADSALTGSHHDIVTLAEMLVRSAFLSNSFCFTFRVQKQEQEHSYSSGFTSLKIL